MKSPNMSSVCDYYISGNGNGTQGGSHEMPSEVTIFWAPET